MRRSPPQARRARRALTLQSEPYLRPEAATASPPMQVLLRIFGPPHELLHLVALWLVGRHPRQVARTHIDISDNLTTRQYVFVAALPALVFGAGALLGVVGLANAATLGQAALGFGAALVFGVGVAGSVNDIQKILLRLQQSGDDSP